MMAGTHETTRPTRPTKAKTNLIQQARPEITLLGWNHKYILLRIKNHVCDVHEENSDE